MSRSIFQSAMVLNALMMILAVNGCSSQTKVISQQEAVFRAKEAAATNGWKQCEVKSVNLENRRWVILVERLPVVFGGHAIVEIADDGRDLRWKPGK